DGFMPEWSRENRVTRVSETAGAKKTMRWRMVLLLLAIVVGVALPWVVTRSTNSSALKASSWVTHSAQVRTVVYKLLYRLRDMEAATYSVLQGVSNADVGSRISQSQQQIGPLLSRLRDLTLDNPDQQSRLGALQSVVDHRVDLMRQALETYSDGHPG